MAAVTRTLTLAAAAGILTALAGGLGYLVWAWLDPVMRARRASVRERDAWMRETFGDDRPRHRQRGQHSSQHRQRSGRGSAEP